MPQEIYNEGRVVGFSAWELFLRHEKNSGVPTEDIPDENEWITSMIGSGASMILKIPSGTTAGVHDFELPEGSKLTAAGVIVASPFLGGCDWTSSAPYWAKKITSYGTHVIANKINNCPSDDGITVPYIGYDTPNDFNNMVHNYLKITDGVVFTKKATWETTGELTPYKDINPEFNNSTTIVRLYISSDLNSNVLILFTGFSNKRILQGFSQWASDEGGHAKNGSADVDKNNWVNGGMLGPEVIPWASKIIFSVPNLASATTSFRRTIPSDTSYTAERIADTYTFQNIDSTVTDSPVIDFNSIRLLDYYDAHTFDGSVTLTIDVPSADNTYNYITAWYPGMTATEINGIKTLSTDEAKKAMFFPPALYGQHIASDGTKTLIPFDVAAPGTVKCFKDSTEAYNYLHLLPDNCAIFPNSGFTYTFVKQGVSSTYWSSTATALVSAGTPVVNMAIGAVRVDTLSFLKSDGQPYDKSGSEGTIVIGPSKVENSPVTQGLNLTWDTLLDSLQVEAGIDVLGSWLRTIGTELSDNSSESDPYTQHKHTLGLIDDYNIDYTATRWFILNPGTKSQNWIKSDSVWIGSKFDSTDNNRYVTFNSGETPASLNLGTDFIKFNNGLKLFVSSTAPDPSVVGAIPNNSIGLGW